MMDGFKYKVKVVFVLQIMHVMFPVEALKKNKNLF